MAEPVEGPPPSAAPKTLVVEAGLKPALSLP